MKNKAKSLGSRLRGNDDLKKIPQSAIRNPQAAIRNP
jgi:hypothetical protein